MSPRSATAESPTARATSEARPRPTWAGWTTSTSTVSYSCAASPELSYIDAGSSSAALGIAEEVAALGLKGTKKKKGKKLDEDFTVSLRQSLRFSSKQTR